MLFGDLQLRRETSGPHADGRIHISVAVGESVSEAAARKSLRKAHDQIHTVAAIDETFANLLRDHRSQWELVHDYGMGTVLIATEDEEGNLVWQSDKRRG